MKDEFIEFTASSRKVMVNLSNVICIRAEETKTAIVFNFMQSDRLADIIVDESYDKVKELIGMSKGGLYTKDHL